MLIESIKSTPNRERHIPGEAGIWVFIMGDMVVFALFFSVFSFYRSEQADLFALSQARLTVEYGVLNTFLLLTSSWFVVMAITAARRQLRKQSAGLFFLAFLCGAAFSAVKIIEYSEKIHAGIYLTTNDFFMFYYIFTGLHFVHVVIGMGLLAFVISKLLKGPSSSEDISFFEIGASYWHMVDVLWIILFPLIYLMR